MKQREDPKTVIRPKAPPSKAVLDKAYRFYSKMERQEADIHRQIIEERRRKDE